MSKIIKYGGGFLAVCVGLLAVLVVAVMLKDKRQATTTEPAPTVSQAPSPATPAQAPPPMQKLAEQVLATYSKRASIDRVELRDVKERSVTYAIWYKSQPSLADVKDDTTALVRATLKKLVAAGINTSADFVFIHAHAYQEVNGETRKMVRVLGKSSYNFNNDKIEFVLKQ